MKKKPNFLDRKRIPLSIAIISLFLFEDIMGGTRPFDIFDFKEPWGMIGLFIVLGGVLLRSWAAGVINKRNSLASTGPYALSRHPLYMGSLLMAIGFCIILNDTENFLLVFVIFPLIYFPKIRQEESDLAKKFGEKWEKYVECTSIFFPKRCPVRLCSHWSITQWLHNKEYRAFFTSLFALGFIELYREIFF